MELILSPSRQLNANTLKGRMLGMNNNVSAPPPYFLGEEEDYSEVEENEIASPEISAMSHAVSLHLEEALRAAKTEYLGAGEVLFPTKLLPSIARDILRMAESEPLGLRGGLILLNFESSNGANDLSHSHSGSSSSSQLTRSLSSSSLSSTSSSESSNSNSSKSKAPPHSRSIGSIKWDPHCVPTFELSLTFRQEWTPWYSRLPNILRLSKKPSVILSGDYVLSKKKLYRSGRH